MSIGDVDEVERMGRAEGDFVHGTGVDISGLRWVPRP